MLKVLCAIDGAREPFQVDINDSDTFSDIQKKIKTESPRPLPHASTLCLFKAPTAVGFNTEPGVTVGAQDEIDTTSSLRGMFAETNTVQVIVRPPRKTLLPCFIYCIFETKFCLRSGTDQVIFLGYKRSPLNAVQYDSRSVNLVWKEDKFRSFPVHGVNDFKTLRQRPELCFFDKTAFILALESFDESVLVFLRPRRSGKSLGLSVLAHFHGREHLPDYKPLFEVSDILSHLPIIFICSKCYLACLLNPLVHACRALPSTST